MNAGTGYTLLAAAGLICSILFAYLGYWKGAKKDCYKEGSHDGNLQSDIKYIMRMTDNILIEQKDASKKQDALAERVTRVEESSKQAHKRIDRIEREPEAVHEKA